MAILQFFDGCYLTDLCDIQFILSLLDIQIDRCESDAFLLLKDRLSCDLLSEFDRQQILNEHYFSFEFLKLQDDYLEPKLLTLHPGSPQLYPLLISSGQYHSHTESEALMILAGEAIFRFVDPDGEPLQLLLQPQDYLHIPAGIRHSFTLSASLQLKAVCYFKTSMNWIGQYQKRQANN